MTDATPIRPTLADLRLRPSDEVDLGWYFPHHDSVLIDGYVPRVMKRQFRSFQDMRSGHLVAIEPRGRDKFGKALWLCRCDCGKEITIPGHRLATGNSKSCGCQSRAMIAAAKRRHGGAPHGKPTTEYRIWAGMVQRCTNPNQPAYHHYGGRGITVCERWQHDFGSFIADMGPRPVGMSLDRIDNDRGYEPANCRWAARPVQHRNHRRNRWYEYNGERLCLTDWAKRLGVKHSRLRYLLDKKGLPIEQAIERLRRAA